MLKVVEPNSELKTYLEDEKVKYIEVTQHQFNTYLNEGNIYGYIVEDKEYIEDNHLISEVKVYSQGEVTSFINKLKLSDDGKARIGGYELQDLNKYMYRMFHPKYKTYLELKEYYKSLKSQGKFKNK